MSESNTQDATDIVVECRNLWKIFGERSRDALIAAREHDMDKDQLFEEYQCVLGVADASFQVQRGEIFCIMGLSGSGKSTLLRHVNRLIEPTAGSVIVDGVAVNELNAAALREMRARTIGMVFQHMALWPHRNIRNNVAYGLEVQGMSKSERFAAADRALQLVKLDGWQDRYPDELSGGMQQRVGLARAFASDPKILLMDEPFSALDPLIRRELQDEFLALSKEMNRTTLFITHDLDEAVRIGNRVAIMKDGVIVQQGTPEEIITNPEGEYVSKFVSGMATIGFLYAEDVMDAPEEKPGEEAAPAVGAEANIRDVLDLMADGAERVAVTEDGKTVGHVTPRSILAAVRNDLEGA